VKGFKEALRMALQKLEDFQVSVEDKDKKEKRNMLMKCAMTALNSKLLSGYKE